MSVVEDPTYLSPSNPNNSSSSTRILNVLLASTQPLCALEISRTCRLDKKQVNIVLYALLKKGHVCLDDTASARAAPAWSATAASVSSNAYQEQEKRLLEILEASQPHGSSTCSISLAMQKPKSLVNQMLYALQNEGRVERVQISPPAWRLRKVDVENVRLGKHGRSGSQGESSVSTSSKEVRIPSSKKPRSINLEKVLGASAPTKLRSITLAEALGDAIVNDRTKEPHKYTIEHGTWAKSCADVVWTKYKELHPTANDHDIIAGFLLKEKDSNKLPRLVALGSGTSIATGDCYSLHGRTVHDMHAEIVARRSLMRFLYSQLQAAMEGRDSLAIFDKENTTFTLKPLELWLYISQAPCGDGAVFSKTDLLHGISDSTTTGKSRGIFRTKAELSCGTSPRREKGEMTFDGIQLGDRAACQSCSDKIAKWNILGVQGALLSRLMAPLYLAGVVVGDLFHHGNISRALCCRSETGLGHDRSPLVSPLLCSFRICHPIIQQVARDTKRHDKVKSHGPSINWDATTDANVEVLDRSTGCVVGSQRASRLSKHSLFSLFCNLVPSAKEFTYGENKQMACEYQASKQSWLAAMEQQYKVDWKHKPVEVDAFLYSEDDKS